MSKRSQAGQRASAAITCITNDLAERCIPGNSAEISYWPDRKEFAPKGGSLSLGGANASSSVSGPRLGPGVMAAAAGARPLSVYLISGHIIGMQPSRAPAAPSQRQPFFHPAIYDSQIKASNNRWKNRVNETEKKM